VVADETKVPKPEPTEAQNAGVIAGIAITACSIGAIVIVFFDLASIKASASLFADNIRAISSA